MLKQMDDEFIPRIIIIYLIPFADFWRLLVSLLIFKFITTQKPWFQLSTLIGNTIFNLNTLAVRTGL